MASQTANNGIGSIPYYCPNCGAIVGNFVPVNGWIRLDAGGWLIGEGERFCHRCGRLIHFKAPQESWQQLVERFVKQNCVVNLLAVKDAGN